MSYVKLKEEQKPAALAALYNASQPLGMGMLHYTPEKMTPEEASELLREQSYFDYLRGRVMKLDFSKDKMFLGLYDRDNGPGAAQRVLTEAIDGVVFVRD